MQLMKCFSDFHSVDPFRRYLGSKSKSVENRRRILEVFCSPKFCWGRPFQIVPMLSPLPQGMSPGRIMRLFLLTPKLQARICGILSSNFNVSPQNFGGRTPVSVCGVCQQVLVNLQHLQNLRAEIQSSEKVDLGGSKLTSAAFWIVDHACFGPQFLGQQPPIFGLAL